ncbi:hypothetical protein [Bdellovibrio sp. BCCA]|uniref:hypothetical protein n=1 Tax=Bdellovibrio sp. BCCA TaxID=3136281 RepID=UPI0030F2D880
MKSLEKGQILLAVVEEAASPSEALCNFQGELLLVANHTGHLFKKGDPIRLQVKSVNPLQFHIFDPRNLKFERVV